MKKIYSISIMVATLFFASSCDKDFELINTNPYAVSSINPGLLFSNIQRATHPGFWEGEQTIVQQFVNAYNLGATAGHNFNEDNNNFNVPRWNDNYNNPIKHIVQVLESVKSDAARPNLYNQARIWKAYIFMTMVDTYGDVPYTEAAQGFLKANFYPKYDQDKIIYEDLTNEIRAAIAALDPAKDLVKEDLLYGTSANTAAQVARWKKLGNSLLLRIGMRYSKIDETKAKTLVQEAFKGGVIQANTDNAFVMFNATYPNQLNAEPRGTNPYFYYLAEPFVNQLKSTADPRMKYISGKYSDPNKVLALTPDTTAANQFGFPVGYDQTTVLKLTGYKGANGTGQNYSQLNYSVFGASTAPIYYVTNAQTNLLLAEAAQKGWITGGLTAKEYYEAGVRASMDEYSTYPGASNPAVSKASQDTFLKHPSIAFSSEKALELINTQYWIACLGNGGESFANFRRSGFPLLKANSYNTNLAGGFVRRMPYPNEESSSNSVNYEAASARMGGDKLTSRIFWDK